MSRHAGISHDCGKKQYHTHRQSSGTGLTRAGLAVLKALKRSKVGPLEVCDIADRTGYAAPTIRKALKELLDMGHIRIEPFWYGRANSYCPIDWTPE